MDHNVIYGFVLHLLDEDVLFKQSSRKKQAMKMFFSFLMIACTFSFLFSFLVIYRLVLHSLFREGGKRAEDALKEPKSCSPSSTVTFVSNRIYPCRFELVLGVLLQHTLTSSYIPSEQYMNF
jgi:hypothetical protein